MGVKVICHLADIHIRKSPIRNEEYKNVFDNLINSLNEKKPDRIVIVGDLVHDYLDLQGEQLILATDFLKSLSNIAPVRIVRGNHDCRVKNIKRVDTIYAIVKTLNDKNIIYYDATNMYLDDNIVWAVWHHGEPKNNPWKLKGIKEFIDKHKDCVFIDLFHDPIYGCKSTTGFDMNSKTYYKISDFHGDISMFGDIHKMQFMNNEKNKAYCGSLIAQDITEGDDEFHGYLLWNVETKSAELIPIYNEHSYKNIRISQFTDFDDLEFEIKNPTKNMTVRFIWGTLPQIRTKDNERKLKDYIINKYFNSDIKIIHKNDFIENENIEIIDNVTLENINDKAVQHEIFREYLTKIGCEEKLINDVIALDDDVLNEINIQNTSGIEWDIIKFGGVNFMSYERLDIDWRDLEGLFQITGMNTAGKTTILKLISYVLYNKTLETEVRMKWGDMRYVNNRNNATFCEGYIVICANSEYYGIKRRTEIKKNKSGDVIDVNTTLNYYILNTPDDEMTNNNTINNLSDDKKNATQNKITDIIGDYDNFMRIVMTTSDTLNRILSNDMAVFIDSLLFDSGLDIFDKKMEGWKVLNKRINDKSRISCNVDAVLQQNKIMQDEIINHTNEINNIENELIPNIQNRILVGRNFIEENTKKLYKIDNDIYNLNINEINNNINECKKNIDELKLRESTLKTNITSLKETYDAEKLEILLKKKEEHKNAEFNIKLEIKNLEQNIRNEEHNIEIINGYVYKLNSDKIRITNEIKAIKDSKVCKYCGQEINKKEHIEHINNTVKLKEDEIAEIDKIIAIKSGEEINKHLLIINQNKNDIIELKKKIELITLEMDSVLNEIGVIINDKNDVEKRKQIGNELNNIPIKIQNEELKINIFNQKITNYHNSLIQIEENKKIEKIITIGKQKLQLLESELDSAKEKIFKNKTIINEKELKIKANNQLIDDYKAQEYRDIVMNLYKKCVHRDGIPKQMLSNYIVPKINATLEKILSVAQFKIWLDINTLRPKLAYHDRPSAVIDCISASGKERTFSSVVLKFALNQINVKSKPAIFLLDEVMGKLDENGIEEFSEILQQIKNNMKRVLIIEHRVNINPDYVIECSLNNDGISSLNLL